MDTISLALHVSAAAVLAGPQLLMFLAVTPATWLLHDDERLRRAVIRVVTARFGMMFAAAVAVLIVTGVYQYVALVPADVRQDSASRFATLFALKMLLFALLLVLTFVHTYRFSRRIARLSDAVIAGTGDRDALERARQRSFGFSMLILVLSFVLLWLGVALGEST